MAVNEEFDFEEVIGEIPKNVKAKKADKILVAESTDAPPSKKKIRIMIDEVRGMSNYEVVAVNGKVWQIKRGVPVDVDPEVVHVLELAQQTITEQRPNPLTGGVDDVHRTFSAIPWRRV